MQGHGLVNLKGPIFSLIIYIWYIKALGWVVKKLYQTFKFAIANILFKSRSKVMQGHMVWYIWKALSTWYIKALGSVVQKLWQTLMFAIANIVQK